MALNRLGLAWAVMTNGWTVQKEQTEKWMKQRITTLFETSCVTDQISLFITFELKVLTWGRSVLLMSVPGRPEAHSWTLVWLLCWYSLKKQPITCRLLGLSSCAPNLMFSPSPSEEKRLFIGVIVTLMSNKRLWRTARGNDTPCGVTWH